MANLDYKTLCRSPYYKQILGGKCNQVSHKKNTGSLYSSDDGHSFGMQGMAAGAVSPVLMVCYIGLLIGLVWLMRKIA